MNLKKIYINYVNLCLQIFLSVYLGMYQKQKSSDNDSGNLYMNFLELFYTV